VRPVVGRHHSSPIAIAASTGGRTTHSKRTAASREQRELSRSRGFAALSLCATTNLYHTLLQYFTLSSAHVHRTGLGRARRRARSACSRYACTMLRLSKSYRLSDGAITADRIGCRAAARPAGRPAASPTPRLSREPVATAAAPGHAP
jgi:hypothetical protein